VVDLVRLKAVADGLHALMDQFERLVRAATPADRHELAQTLLAMLNDCR
jgi:hypothetical protein